MRSIDAAGNVSTVAIDTFATEGVAHPALEVVPFNPEVLAIDPAGGIYVGNNFDDFLVLRLSPSVLSQK